VPISTLAVVGLVEKLAVYVGLRTVGGRTGFEKSGPQVVLIQSPELDIQRAASFGLSNQLRWSLESCCIAQ
jgi:hypothetical protein